jgi:L,D-transpeptidase ErfK/SrfK
MVSGIAQPFAFARAVTWVRSPRRRRPGIPPSLLGPTLLFTTCTLTWAPGVRAAEALSPGSSKPELESGAAALLEDAPLQLRLQENGPPQPEAPQPRTEPTPAPVRPAGVQGSPPRLLILNRRERLLRVMEHGKEVRRYPVAVGMPGWETPVGTFAVMEKTANPKWEHPANGQVLPPGPNNPLGSRWIGFHRDCQGRSGFNGQEHLVVKGCVTAGFHGTPNRASVGQAVSHGCVRLFDEHARELFDLVSLGTPVTVLP